VERFEAPVAEVVSAEENAVSMTCREAIDVLADYLDQSLSRDVAERLAAHLRDCRPCIAYLATYRKTRELVGRTGRPPMPEELKGRLRRFLLDQLREGRT
jgi:anti-sigma factor (TIGR02949 family)